MVKILSNMMVHSRCLSSTCVVTLLPTALPLESSNLSFASLMTSSFILAVSHFLHTYMALLPFFPIT